MLLLANIYSQALFYPSVVKSISKFRADNHSNQLQQQQCNKSQFPSEWPHFAPLYFEQLITLIDSEENQKTIVVVVEWPESLTGKEVKERFANQALKNKYRFIFS